MSLSPLSRQAYHYDLLTLLPERSSPSASPPPTPTESDSETDDRLRKVQRHNAELERQVQARTAELQLAYNFEATLKRITDKVRDSLDVNQILQTAVRELARTIGAACCNAALYDLDHRTSTIHYEYNQTLSPYLGRVVDLDGYPEVYNQLLNGQAFQFCSLSPNPVRGRVAMLTCPIVDDQGVLGDLWLINTSYSRFSDPDLRLVQQVANQCAIALRQARLFQASQAQVKELEQLNRLKDEFLSTVSHELRTPMTNIKLATQMLEVGLQHSGILDDKNHRIGQYFKILQSECRREIGLINDLLDLSRLDSGSEELNLTQLHLPTWLPSIINPFMERAEKQQQHIQISIAPYLSDLTTDKAHLERILAELLNNACKYTPSGGIITLAVATFDSTLTLSLTNSGVEIPAQELPRIFEKFYRVPNHDPWQHGGTGLGLALVKKLVTHLRGNISVESRQNQTRFILEFPL